MARKKKAPVTANTDEVAVYAFLYFCENDLVRAAKSKLAALKKEMGQKGVLPKEIERAFREIARSPAERQADQERFASYLQAVGAPVQLELFEMSVPRRNDLEAEARNKGRLDAINGRHEIDIPFPAGSAEGQAWMEGHRGLHALVEGYRNRFNTVDHEDIDDDAPPPKGHAKPFGDDGPQATDALADALIVQSVDALKADVAAGAL